MLDWFIMVLDVNLSQTISDLLTNRYSKEVSDSVKRLQTGLKINNASDNSAAIISSNNFRNKSSELIFGIQSASQAAAVVQITNQSLSQQEEILQQIRDKLDLAKPKSTSENTQEAIRIDIVGKLEELDKIAAGTNYNNIFTLQKSDNNNDYSQSTIILFDTGNSATLSTQSIRANTQGLQLDVLKDLNTNELTAEVATEQISLINNALDTLSSYQDGFNETQNDVKIAVNELTLSQEYAERSYDDLIKADIQKEQIVFDKYKLLEESSEFAFIQANTSQANVLSLLATTLTQINTYEKPLTKLDEINTQNDTLYNNDKPFTQKTSNSEYNYNNPSTKEFSNSTSNLEESSTE